MAAIWTIVNSSNWINNNFRNWCKFDTIDTILNWCKFIYSSQNDKTILYLFWFVKHFSVIKLLSFKDVKNSLYTLREHVIMSKVT